MANNTFIASVFVTALISTVAARRRRRRQRAGMLPRPVRYVWYIWWFVSIIYRISNMSRGRSAPRPQLARAEAPSVGWDEQTGQRSRVRVQRRHLMRMKSFWSSSRWLMLYGQPLRDCARHNYNSSTHSRLTTANSSEILQVTDDFSTNNTHGPLQIITQ